VRKVLAHGLTVYPPNDRHADTLTFSFETCRKHSATSLEVTTTIAGTGIPVFSF